MNYYNELDRQKAAWLRELVKAGVIAEGEVDERSIADLKPADLMGYAQCHFFAGVGVWSYALRLAGWPDSRGVWTGSCPCPSFSAAGKGGGFDDTRHLWPHWARLISECQPAVVFGEQVDDAIGFGWLDLVQTDLEAAAYAVGKAVLGACSVGAPTIRQRLFFVAESQSGRSQCFSDTGRRGSIVLNEEGEPEERLQSVGGHSSGILRMAESEHAERRPLLLDRQDGCDGQDSGRPQAHGDPGACGEVCRLGEPSRQRLQGRLRHGDLSYQSGRLGANEAGSVAKAGELSGLAIADGGQSGDRDLQRGGQHGLISQDRGTGDGDQGAGPLNGYWRDADWLLCRDGKWRPVRPGTFPLASGASTRVLRLRGYGDAINAEVAKAFIESYLETKST